MKKVTFAITLAVIGSGSGVGCVHVKRPPDIDHGPVGRRCREAFRRKDQEKDFCRQKSVPDSIINH